MPRSPCLVAAVLLSLPVAAEEARAPDVLPGTTPLTEPGDLAAKMVAGIDAYLMRELVAAPGKRSERWKALDYSSPEVYVKSVAPLRERFKKIIGVVDARKPVTALEYVGTTTTPSTRAVGPRYTVHAVRWPVFEGVEGEGLLLQPHDKPLARVVVIPDAAQSPEQSAGFASDVSLEDMIARDLADSGCQVLVPVLIDRADTWSGHPAIRMTNQPHREWIYRAAYMMGRHVIGYEVQKISAAVDWFLKDAAPGNPHVFVVGHGEGGLLALYAAAADPRIDGAVVSGYFQEREGIWQEPIYRNVWSLLRDFGDAEIAALIAPRRLWIQVLPGPDVAGPPPPREGRSGAAPGRLTSFPLDSTTREYDRAKAVFERLGATANLKMRLPPKAGDFPLSESLPAELLASIGAQPRGPVAAPRPAGLCADPLPRLHRQFDQLNEYTQRLVRESEKTREKFWAKADTSSIEKFVETSKPYREYLWNEVIGKLPPPTEPMNARTRKVYDEPKWTGYEVTLDLYPDVFAYGILLLPKDLKPGERRPVVVCQHGLEGRPRDTIETNGDGFHYYQAFSAKLAERGFVVYAPQNPYIGQNVFRQVQRKANPLGLSLYSFIVRQHERTLDWLAEQPFVDPKRIGFYGLSYGGKTAVRVPTILADRYALSICSGDYNEWIRKNTSIDHGVSYMFYQEYEMFDFDLGNTFNYAELAGLMVPRPFMVERGHRDGVGYDEWVAYEYAKVKRLYDELGIGDRTTIEYFNGPHMIHGVGTFEFLQKHLGWPPSSPPPKSGGLPVRWTNHIALNKIEDIEKVLDEPVDMSKSRGELELTGPQGKKVKVKTGRQYFDLVGRGFHAVTTYDLTMESWFTSSVGYVPYLQRAVPAKVSYLENFQLSADALQDLPLEIGPYLGEMEPLRQAVATGKTWKDFYPGLKVDKCAATEIEVSDEGMSESFQVLAWGDFNRDGVEDLLLYVSLYSLTGSFRSYNLVVVTRKEKGAKLAVVEK